MSYPIWTAPVAPGHQIANVREMRRAGDAWEFVSYSLVIPKNGFAANDWDRFVLSQ